MGSSLSLSLSLSLPKPAQNAALLLLGAVAVSASSDGPVPVKCRICDSIVDTDVEQWVQFKGPWPSSSYHTACYRTKDDSLSTQVMWAKDNRNMVFHNISTPDELDSAKGWEKRTNATFDSFHDEYDHMYVTFKGDAVPAGEETTKAAPAESTTGDVEERGGGGYCSDYD